MVFYDILTLIFCTASLTLGIVILMLLITTKRVKSETKEKKAETWETN